MCGRCRTWGLLHAATMLPSSPPTELVGSEAELQAYSLPADLADSVLAILDPWLSSSELASAKDVVKKSMANFRDEMRRLVLGSLKKAVEEVKPVQNGDEDGRSWRAALVKEDDLDEMRRVSAKNLRKVELASKLRDGVAKLTEEQRGAVMRTTLVFCNVPEALLPNPKAERVASSSPTLCVSFLVYLAHSRQKEQCSPKTRMPLKPTDLCVSEILMIEPRVLSLQQRCKEDVVLCCEHVSC